MPNGLLFGFVFPAVNTSLAVGSRSDGPFSADFDLLKN